MGLVKENHMKKHYLIGTLLLTLLFVGMDAAPASTPPQQQTESEELPSGEEDEDAEGEGDVE